MRLGVACAATGGTGTEWGLREDLVGEGSVEIPGGLIGIRGIGVGNTWDGGWGMRGGDIRGSFS